MRKRKRTNWRRFFEKNKGQKKFSMYQLIRNLPETKKPLTNLQRIKLRHRLQKRYKIKITQ
jgi:hypothetical protein